MVGIGDQKDIEKYESPIKGSNGQDDNAKIMLMNKRSGKKDMKKIAMSSSIPNEENVGLI